MNFTVAIKTCLNKKYLDFTGRASRSEYWWFYLYFVIMWGGAKILDTSALGYSAYEWGPISSMIYLVFVVPWLAVHCRRLHDTGKSGWGFLLYFTIIGAVIVLAWLCQEGDPQDNRYGESPYSAGSKKPKKSVSESLAILERRFANGEIEENEYRARKKVLEGSEGKNL